MSNNVFIDFLSLRQDAKYSSPITRRPPFRSPPKKIHSEEFDFSQNICENGNLRYVKYTRAKKQKLLQNLKNLIAKNILYISINYDDKHATLDYDGRFKCITEVTCLENEELSFR